MLGKLEFDSKIHRTAGLLIDINYIDPVNVRIFKKESNLV